MRRLAAVLLTILALSLLVCGAMAESVRVQTPGGGVKMRKTPEAKGKLVDTVPNHALVEAEETDGEWTRITYKNKSGYVKNEFLLLPEALVGQTVYPDNETAVLRTDAAEDAAVAGVYNGHTALTVLETAEAWARVHPREGGEGWMPLSELTWHYAEPSAELAWIPQPGTTTETVAWTGASHALPAGAPVTVLSVSDVSCLVKAGEEYGELPVALIALDGPAESGDSLPGLAREEAENRARAVFKKKNKSEEEDLYCVTGTDTTLRGMDHPVYHCGFFDENDRYVRGVLVDPDDGTILFSGDYHAFALKPAFLPLPEGEVEIALSAEEIALGDVVDIRVSAWSRHAVTWAIEGDSIASFRGEEGTHFQAAYRPRQPGRYTVTVTVRDEQDRTETASAAFVVTERADALPLSPVYSQKDGWWKDKTYRTSNLDRSGCAVFALAHALYRMGFDGEDTRPEALAKKYALCLTPDGTNNERLVREASQVYGYRTRSEPLSDRKKVIAALREGAFFSFGVVRGHIALVDGLSEDGTMVHVVDSAPGATWERKGKMEAFRQSRGGRFYPAQTPEDLPGARWYFDQEAYGGLEYWIRLEDVLDRNLRLIQPLQEEE